MKKNVVFCKTVFDWKKYHLKLLIIFEINYKILGSILKFVHFFLFIRFNADKIYSHQLI